MLNLKEIVALTSLQNKRSLHVMKKMGMSPASGDVFDHPNFSAQHPLKKHILYRMEKKN